VLKGKDKLDQTTIRVVEKSHVPADSAQSEYFLRSIVKEEPHNPR